MVKTSGKHIHFKESERVPLFSEIIPAHNEQNHIAACLESTVEGAKVASHEPEMIVVLNRSTDDTERIAQEYGAKIVKEPAKNLARIRNTGAREASGDILITIETDSRKSLDIHKKQKRILDMDRSIGDHLCVGMDRWSPGIICTLFLIMSCIMAYLMACTGIKRGLQ